MATTRGLLGGLGGLLCGCSFRGGLVPKTLWGRIVAGAGLLLLTGGGIAAGLAVRSYVLHDEHFVVPGSESIQIAGNTHVTRAQLLSVFGEDVERNSSTAAGRAAGGVGEAALGGACDGDAAAAEPGTGGIGSGRRWRLCGRRPDRAGGRERRAVRLAWTGNGGGRCGCFCEIFTISRLSLTATRAGSAPTLAGALRMETKRMSYRLLQRTAVAAGGVGVFAVQRGSRGSA